MTLKFEYNAFRILLAFGFSNVKYKGTTFFMILKSKSGAPNENVVQNHLNIALLNVF